MRVDWVGESSSESITLCGVEGEDIRTGQTLCPDCAQVADALHVCGLGPESLRELFDTLRVIGPSPSLLNPLFLALDDSRSVLAVKGTLRRFAPWTAPGRSEGMAVYEGKGG